MTRTMPGQIWMQRSGRVSMSLNLVLKLDGGGGGWLNEGEGCRPHQTNVYVLISTTNFHVKFWTLTYYCIFQKTWENFGTWNNFASSWWPCRNPNCQNKLTILHIRFSSLFQIPFVCVGVCYMVSLVYIYCTVSYILVYMLSVVYASFIVVMIVGWY